MGRLGTLASVVVPLAIAVVAACAAQPATTGSATATTGTSLPATTATTLPDDLEMQASDFVNVNDMTRVRGFFIDNPIGRLDEAVAVANSPEGGVYPVGTVIQLVPQEAMVKRKAGFSPFFGDWEFFELKVSAAGTEITKRGDAEIVNRFGGSCATCHSKADVRFDFVCEKDRGCDPLPIGEEVFRFLQETDPRPRR